MSDGIAQNDVEAALTYMYQAENLPILATVEGLRWKVLVGSDGARIGTIETILTIEDVDRVEFIEVGRGGFLGFGAERFLVPVTVIVQVDEKQVAIDRSLQQLEGAPHYDHSRMKDPDYCDEIRSWWQIGTLDTDPVSTAPDSETPPSSALPT